MKIVLLGPYPRVEGRPEGGVQAAVESLARGLSLIGEHVVVIDPFTGHPTAPTSTCDVVRLPRIASWQAGWVGAPSRLRQAIAEVAPDILHVHLGAQYSRLHNSSVLTVHGFPHYESWLRNPGVKGQFSAAILRRAFVKGITSAKHIVAISPEVTQLAQRVGIPSVPIPNPVALEFFEVERSPGDDFVAVGNIMRRKNQRLLISSFVQYAREGGRGDLLLVGDVEDHGYYAECKEIAASVGQRVRFLGPLERTDVARQLGRARGLVSTSLRETSSIAIAEALAANCPVLSLDVGTVGRQISQVDHGIVLSVDASVADVANALHALAASRTGETLRRAVASQHPVEVARRTREIYEDVLCRFAGTV